MRFAPEPHSWVKNKMQMQKTPAICYGHLLDYRFLFALYTENIWAYTFLWYNFHCQIILPAVQKNYKNSVQLHSFQFSAVSADSSSHEFSPAGEYRGPPPHYPLSHYRVGLFAHLFTIPSSLECSTGCSYCKPIDFRNISSFKSEIFSVGRLKWRIALNVPDKHFFRWVKIVPQWWFAINHTAWPK